MAKPRRSTVSRRKSRSVLWLITGLLLGAALMWGAQYLLYRDGKPFSGLASLFSSDKKPVEKKEDKKPPEAERPQKPKLDFYTILPEYETVLPEPKGGKKPAKTDIPEGSVSYVLQAASFVHLEDADRLKAKLAFQGLEARIEKITVGDKGTYYRVRLGPYSSLDTLDAVNDKLAQLGIKALRIKLHKPART